MGIVLRLEPQDGALASRRPLHDQGGRPDSYALDDSFRSSAASGDMARPGDRLEGCSFDGRRVPVAPIALTLPSGWEHVMISFSHNQVGEMPCARVPRTLRRPVAGVPLTRPARCPGLPGGIEGLSSAPRGHRRPRRRDHRLVPSPRDLRAAQHSRGRRDELIDRPSGTVASAATAAEDQDCRHESPASRRPPICPPSQASGSRLTSSSWRSAGTCALACPTATSRNCSPSGASKSITSRSTGGWCGSRRCWPESHPPATQPATAPLGSP